MKVPYEGNQNVYHQQVPYIAARGEDMHAGQVRRTGRAMCPTNMQAQCEEATQPWKKGRNGKKIK